jgi:TRAP-type C4-dicarboxylate transport system permease small subunit
MTAGLMRLLARLEAVTGAIAAAAMFLIMMIATADVAMRYLFNNPFAWAYDLIAVYLMVGLFYFVLSGTFAHNAHVAVDILQGLMSPVMRRLCEITTCTLSAGLFALIAYAGAERAWASFVAGDVMAGIIEWPTWPSIALVPLGAGMLTLRLVLHALAHVLSLFSAEPVIAFVPVAGSPEAIDREMAE